jgi:hypothetical protein
VLHRFQTDPNVVKHLPMVSIHEMYTLLLQLTIVKFVYANSLCNVSLHKLFNKETID